MKSQQQLDEFVAYCKEHPDQRFFQALRNWSGYDFIMGCPKGACDLDDIHAAEDLGLEDTFYKE